MTSLHRASRSHKFSKRNRDLGLGIGEAIWLVRHQPSTSGHQGCTTYGQSSGTANEAEVRQALIVKGYPSLFSTIAFNMHFTNEWFCDINRDPNPDERFPPPVKVCLVNGNKGADEIADGFGRFF
nr:hypothetical protein Iba_chr14bCG12270 [Ipomoea batatas]